MNTNILVEAGILDVPEKVERRGFTIFEADVEDY